MQFWEILGIEPTKDLKEIKRSYAYLLKKNRPEDNALAFANLRAAYEQALAYGSAGSSKSAIDAAIMPFTSYESTQLPTVSTEKTPTPSKYQLAPKKIIHL